MKPNEERQIAEGMKAVYWNEEGEEIEQGTEGFDWNNWFDYKAQTGTEDGKTSRWANAKTEDGSYWVWIPRFEYKITAPTGNVTTSSAGKIEVRFISTETKEGSEGYTTTTASLKTVGGTTVADEGITISSDGYIIHPAFTSKVEVGGWDKELSGFWVAKYEMSMEGNTETNAKITDANWKTLEPTVASSSTAIAGNIATTNTIEAYNETASDANKKTTSVIDGETTYNSIRAVSKPNVSSWRYINISNSYENAYNYNRELESHLMKNSEWGAVAYLTHSQYGRNGNEITINDNSECKTGDGDYKANVTQSTTGNITGIYDLSGGAWERVAAYNSAYPSTGGAYSKTSASYASAIGTNMGAIGLEKGSTKYLTEYKNSTEQNVIKQDGYTSFVEFKEAGEKISITGDAMAEVHISGTSYWNQDYACFTYSSRPFLVRGDYYNGDITAGLFSSYGYSGAAGVTFSFRAVCSL